MNHPPLAAPPYRRWFLWLLVGCLLALVMPYANRGDGQFYSPGVGTFVQTERGLVPTTGPIWIDSRTAALLGAGRWLWCGLLPVFFEACWIGWFVVHQRAAWRSHTPRRVDVGR